MKYRLFISGILVAFIIYACKEQKKSVDTSEDSKKMEQVMAIHDEVMPKMSTIGKLVAELKPKADSTELGMKYGNAMTDLQDAHKAMMDWMQGFGDRFDSDEILNGKALTAEKKEWLNEEEEKVKALKIQINTSIENAEKILEGSE